jgi:hypothetical protein
LPSSNQLFISDALPKNAISDHAESVEVGNEVLFGSAIVIPEHLLIKVTKQMERLNGNIGAMQTTLHKRPEILKAIGVYFAAHVSLSMVHNLMRIVISKSPIAVKIISMKLAAGMNV